MASIVPLTSKPPNSILAVLDEAGELRGELRVGGCIVRTRAPFLHLFRSEALGIAWAPFASQIP